MGKDLCLEVRDEVFARGAAEGLSPHYYLNIYHGINQCLPPKKEWERIERVTLEKLEEIKAERLIQMERAIETFNLDTAYAGYSKTIIDRYKRFRGTGKVDYCDRDDKRSIEESWTRVDKAKGMAKECWTRGTLFDQQQLELQVKLAISKEKEYERCSYRRTANCFVFTLFILK